MTLFERCRRFVGCFAVRSQADRFPLGEMLLEELGFDDLLCAMKTIRALKEIEALVSARQIADEMSARHGVSREAARRIVNDVRIGALYACDPMDGDPLNALIDLNAEMDDDHDYGELFAIWVEEPAAKEKAIDIICRSAAAKQLAREFVLEHGLLFMAPDAWPQSYWSGDGNPPMLALTPEYDGVQYDLMVLRRGGPNNRIFVICDGSHRSVPREGDSLVSLTAQDIARNPKRCAEEILRRLGPEITDTSKA